MAIEGMLRRMGEWLRKRYWFLISDRFGFPPTAADAPSSIDALSCFQQLIGAMDIKAAVEFGTAQAVPGRSSHMLGLFPKLERSNYTMVDIKTGPDVDVVADLHSLPLEWSSRYDACIANAVFEHLERPWIAAKEIARILAPGGVCYISTHQTFPLHGYPKDFFRFSTDALSLIFSDAGLEVLFVGYAHRTKIILPLELLAAPHLDAWNKEFPSYALVTITCRKP
jgi:SAM-dependent methyltransferase